MQLSFRKLQLLLFICYITLLFDRLVFPVKRVPITEKQVFLAD